MEPSGLNEKLKITHPIRSYQHQIDALKQIPNRNLPDLWLIMGLKYLPLCWSLVFPLLPLIHALVMPYLTPRNKGLLAHSLNEMLHWIGGKQNHSCKKNGRRRRRDESFTKTLSKLQISNPRTCVCLTHPDFIYRG